MTIVAAKCAPLIVLSLLGACGSPNSEAGRVKLPSLKVLRMVRCDTSGAAQERLESGGKAYCFSPTPLLTEKDVASATEDESAKGRPVVLTLNETARNRMREFTGHNIGSYAGTFVNGRLLSVPMIAGPTSQLWITGYTAEEEKSLLQSFRTTGQAR